MIEDRGAAGDTLDDTTRADAPRAGSLAHRSSRLAFASALAVVVLSSLSLFAGAGIASPGASAGAGQKSSSDDQYELGTAVQPPTKTTVVVKSAVTTTPTTTATTTATTTSGPGTLPFTGLSLIGTLALGGALVGVGIALRRRDSRE